TNNEVTGYPPLAEEEHEAERIRREVVSWYLRRSTDGASDVVWLAQELFERIRLRDREATLSVLARLVQIGEGGVLSAKSALIEATGWADAQPDDFSNEEHQFIAMSAIEERTKEGLGRPAKALRPWWRSVPVMIAAAGLLLAIAAVDTWLLQRTHEANQARA